MSDPHGGQPFPKAVGYAVIAMLAVIVTLTAIVSYQRHWVTPPDPLVNYQDTEALTTISVRFEKRPDGALSAWDVRTGRELAVYENGENSFAVGVIRSLARLRNAENLVLVTPMQLTAWADGRLSLFDPQTRGLIELGSFGTHKQVFVELMKEAGALRDLSAGGRDVASADL
ncbi:MAG: photosynthetic complex assembly protein PuhC [Myxococcota bacterium]